jgi:hypothetical protein
MDDLGVEIIESITYCMSLKPKYLQSESSDGKLRKHQNKLP